MSAQAIERNYRKNPHTARFLQTFHSGIGSNGRNYREELGVVASETEDLLDSVPVEAPAYQPSEKQMGLIVKLEGEVAELDLEAGKAAVAYTERMEGHWTPKNTSRWIGNLIAKVRELRAAAPKVTVTAEVADGRYAVEVAGTLRFFKVKNGNRPGFVFLDVQASDDWHAIHNVSRIREIVALIAVDPKAAMIRYGQELGECGHCGRTLTDEASRAAGIGPICASK